MSHHIVFLIRSIECLYLQARNSSIGLTMDQIGLLSFQILKEIWESVSKNFTISWLEVLEFRWNSVGTSEQAIRALNFRFLERMHQIREKNSTSSYRNYRHVQPMGVDPSVMSLAPSAMTYHQPMANNSTILPAMCKPDSVYPTEGNFFFTPVDTVGTLSNRFVHPYVRVPPINSYYPMSQTAQGNSTTSSATRVPTGRLIELDTPLPVANYERSLSMPNDSTVKPSKSRIHDSEMDEVDFRRCLGDDVDRAEYARVEKKPVSKLSHANEDGKINDWEFVYKSLESLGYSKDLGEREDVLRKKEMMLEARNSSRAQQKSSRPLANVEQEEYAIRFVKDDKRKTKSGTVKGTNFNEDDSSTLNGQEHRGTAGRKTLSSGWQDSANSTGESTSERSKKYSNTLPSSRSLYKSGNDHQAVTKNVDSTRDNKQSAVGDTDGRWNCATCTFLNRCGREICEMCGKSRRKGNEDKPLASGGKQCPKCTLVNEKNAATCEACSTSLKDSPTYI